MTTQIGIGYRDSNVFPHHWQEISSDFTINRPCIIILGGSSTNTPSEANGYIKLVEQIAGVAGIDESKRVFDIIAPYYIDMGKDDSSSAERYLFLAQKGCASETTRSWYATLSDEKRQQLESPKYIQDLYNRLFRPLITQDNGSKRLSLRQATFNMGRIHFISHSHGSFVVLKLQDMMDREMKKLGYKKAERRLIFSKATWIDCAGAQVPYGFSQMDTVHFSSFNDEEMIKGQHPQLALPRILDEHHASKIGKDQNIVISISDTEHLWLTHQFSKQQSCFYNPNAEHSFEPFVKGAWKPLNKSSRQISFIISALVQANISNAVLNESHPIIRRPWAKRVEDGICYQQGPHVIKREKPKENQINITSDRLTVKQKREIVSKAIQNGKKYQRIPFIIDLNQHIRDQVAQELKKKVGINRHVEAIAFHQRYPYYRTALKQKQ